MTIVGVPYGWELPVAFTVDDFQDLVSLLEQRPEWRSALRRLVLSDELLELPGIVQGLARAIAELRATVAGLAEAQRRTEAVVAQLAEAQRHTDAGLAELRGVVAETQRRTDARLDRIESRMDEFAVEQRRMGDDVATLKGESVERRYREHAGSYFQAVVRRPVALTNQALVDLLDPEDGSSPFTAAERSDVLNADVIVRGRRYEDGQEVYLVVEVSAGIGPSDVNRAVRRAGLLSRIRPAIAVVAGDRVLPDAARAADEHGVWRLTDGTAVPPSGR